MSQRLRIIALSLLLVMACLALPQAKGLTDEVADWFDNRPAITVLFIGNSRTFFNDMPFMVRTIADSARSSHKYEITMHAPGGVRLQDLWLDPEVQKLLRQKWDFVVIQGRSNEQLDASVNASFMTYGKKLIEQAQSNGSTPVLYVTWRYADDAPLYKQAPQLKSRLHDMMQESYAGLANATGAQMVNVGKVWEELRRAAPQMKLYYDTNHPSISGSYLCALMFYRFFSHDDLNNVTYVPEGISQLDADLIKTAAQAW